jgi:mannose-6-phosphate isomerase-like protein (cupin superfamily)
MQRTRLFTYAAILVFSAAVVSSAGAAEPSVMNIDSLLSVHLIGDDQQLQSDKIGGDSLSSVHLTQVRGEVEPHRHLYHQETVWVIRGAGRLTLDGVKHKVAAGSVVVVPPGTPHSFYNLGKTPTVLISVFSPGFDGKDRVYENPAGH